MPILRTVAYVCLGYLSGSILFARLFAALLKKRDITSDSPDHNPGTFNAFRYGGFWCGMLTLCGDLLKGFLPVYCYLHASPIIYDVGLAIVLVAPVVGHVLPIFHSFQGGKGIAVSFGCLLGLMPNYQPVVILAFFFILFSVVVKITPNYHRTLITYLCSVIAMGILIPEKSVSLGFTLVAAIITVKLLFSKEEKEICKVKIIWKR